MICSVCGVNEATLGRGNHYCARCWDLPAPRLTKTRWDVLQRGTTIGRIFIEHFIKLKRDASKGERVLFNDISKLMSDRFCVKVMTPAEGPSEGKWHTKIDSEHRTRTDAIVHVEVLLARNFGVSWRCAGGHVPHAAYVWCMDCNREGR